MVSATLTSRKLVQWTGKPMFLWKFQPFVVFAKQPFFLLATTFAFTEGSSLRSKTHHPRWKPTTSCRVLSLLATCFCIGPLTNPVFVLWLVLCGGPNEGSSFAFSKASSSHALFTSFKRFFSFNSRQVCGHDVWHLPLPAFYGLNCEAVNFGVWQVLF